MKLELLPDPDHFPDRATIDLTMNTSDSPLKDRFVAAHRALEGTILNGSSSHIHDLRKRAIQSFKSLGFPAAKTEAWKYTPVHKWLPDPSVLADKSLIKPAETTIPEIDGHMISEAYHAVCVDGVLAVDRSRLPDGDSGVIVSALTEAFQRFPDLISDHLGRYADHQSESFTALNTAFLEKGLFVYIPSGVELDRPLYISELLTASGGAFIQPRTLILAEEDSRSTIVQLCTQGPPVATFENAVTEVYVGARARLDHYHIFDRGEKAVLIDTLQVYQKQASHFSTNHVTFTASLVRSNLNILPDAEECETHLTGICLVQGASHVDVHSLVDHAKPGCMSNELYKFILDDTATGVFNGKVLVRQDAQQTNAYQTNRCILLSRKAQMYSKPELEIYADDVRCSHGATTGQLDDEAIFYLRSRGLDLKSARLLLLEAFARDVLDLIRVEPIRDRLVVRLRELLSLSRSNPQ